MADVTQVIKYEGDNKTFIWKHPVEDFHTGTQLIVHESQRAIFFMNGQALDEFPAGRHTLETQNIPMVKKLFNNITDGETAFHCEVYFINLTEQMGIKWGLPNKVIYSDPNFNNYPFEVGCRGEMTLRVQEPRKLLVKLVGTTNGIEQGSLIDKFKAQMVMKINSYLPVMLEEKATPIYKIGQYAEELSQEIHKRLLQDYEEYGVTIPKFWIEEILLPKDDPLYRKTMQLSVEEQTGVREEQLRQQREMVRQDTVQRQKFLDAEAQAYSYRVRGITAQEELAYDVAKTAAANEGSGGMAALGQGVGMMGSMIGVGSAVAGIATNAMEPIRNSFGMPPAGATQMPVGVMGDAPEMLRPADDSVVKQGQVVSDGNGFEERMNKLMMAKEKGFISEEEFETKRQEILSEI